MNALAPEGRPATATAAPADVFAALDISAALRTAAETDPRRLLIADRTDALDAATLDARASHVAGALLGLGLRSGERILLTGGAEAATIVALAGALRAGLDVALFPLHLPLKALATYVRDVGAVALVGPTRYGPLDCGDNWLAAAADTPSLRLLATIGPEEQDGAVDLSPAGLAKAGLPATAVAATGARPRIITAERGAAGVRAIVHHQATLMVAALDIVARAGIAHHTPILSTLPPMTFAGLAAGPLAALLAGTSLRLDGPFEAETFVDALGALDQPHLLVPAALGADLARAGLADTAASLLLLSRAGTLGTLATPAGFPAPCALVDLFAIGETAAVAEQRRGGLPISAASDPHRVALGGRDLLAIERTTIGGTSRLRGAGVTAAPL